MKLDTMRCYEYVPTLLESTWLKVMEFEQVNQCQEVPLGSPSLIGYLKSGKDSESSIMQGESR